MNLLNDIFDIDFSTDLYIKSAETVVPSWLENTILKRSEENNKITDKFQQNKIYIPNVINLDIIKEKFSKYKIDNISVVFSLQELKKISYYSDKIIEEVEDYELLASLFDKNWRDRFLYGFIYFILNKWSDIEYDNNYKLFREYITSKACTYNGHKARLLKIKENITYLEDGGATKFGKMLKSKGISILEASTILGLKEGAITYNYFSKVIQSFYHKDYNNYTDLELVLDKHNSTDTNKIIISEKINYINKENLIDYISEVKSYALKFIGDPATLSRWGTVGFNNEDAVKVKKAHETLNRWMIQMYIDVVFSTMIEDPRRKIFWLKYIDYITSFKVIGSTLNKQKLQSNPQLKDSLQYYFKETVSERTKITCAMLIEIKGHYFVEFSDLGALYVYKKSNDTIYKLLMSDIDKIEKLKITSYNSLVSQDNGFYYHYPEGRMPHLGSWEVRLTSWFRKILKIHVE